MEHKTGFVAAAIQLKPVLNDFECNIATMERLFLQVTKENPDVELIVMPELCTTGYECGRQYQAMSEDLAEGPSIKRMSHLCKEQNTFLIYGFVERGTGDLIYDSAVIISDQGCVLGSYRKVHLFAEESKWFCPGDSYPIFQTRLGNVGICICYDISFPEPARVYALEGADFLVLPSNWEKPHVYEWELTTAARAYDNTLHLIAANRYGAEQHYDFFGQSRILNPLGRVIKQCNQETEGYITAVIDPNLTTLLRNDGYNFLRERKPQTYSRICN